MFLFTCTSNLYSKGFDIWCLEMRGSNLSFHLDYHRKPSVRQWEFDDYLTKDLPRAIDFILEHTNSTSLHFIGHVISFF